ncbi:MAG: hypothetical protein WDW38_005891 [Sanguina aurantia]
MALFKIGIVADTQYGDKDDGHTEGRVQRFREVPNKLQDAVNHWQSENVALVLTLGDTIEGRATLEETLVDLKVLTDIYQELAHTPVAHIVGNHDLSIPRSTYLQLLGHQCSYYTKPISPGWKLLVLDTTDLCPLSGFPEDSPAMIETRQFEASHSVESFPNMTRWNGGLAAQQRGWLQTTLEEAESSGDRLVVAAHHPIGLGSARPSHLAWNWLEVQAILVSSPAVAIVFAGHDHIGGYSQVGHVHFVTLEAMLEAPSGSNAYAIATVHEHMIELQGFGTATSRQLPLTSPP